MDIKLIFLVVTLNLYNCGAEAEGKNPGVLAFVSNHGVDDIVEATADYYAEQLLHNVYKFKNISGTFKVLLWHWEWSLTNIQFREVSKPYAQAWTTDKSITIALKDLSMDLDAQAEAHSRHKLFHGLGDLYAHACFDVVVQFSIGPNNTAKVTRCSAKFSCLLHISVNTNYPGPLNTMIKNSMEERMKAQMVCDSMSRFTTDYQVYTVIHDPGFAIDLSIKHLLGINRAGIAMALNGEVFSYTKGPLGDRNPMPSPQLPSSTIFNAYKMVTFVLSPYMLNTFFLTSKRLGLLDEEVNTTLLPPDKRVLFATDCVDICIGKQIPKIGEMYPNQFVLFRITALETINTDIDQGGITLTNSGEFTFFIGNITLLTMKFDLALNATPYIRPNTKLVNGILNEQKFDNIRMLYSTVGHVPNDVLEWLTDTINEVNILPNIHETFERGVDMGTFICVPRKDKLKRQKVQFNDIQVQLEKGAMVVSADFTLKIKSIGYHFGSTDDNMVYIGPNGLSDTSAIHPRGTGNKSANTIP